MVFHLIEIIKCILHFKALWKLNKSKFLIDNISITDDVNCPWLAVDELILLFELVWLAGKIPPGKLVKRFTGDEVFCIFETIVVDDGRL